MNGFKGIRKISIEVLLTVLLMYASGQITITLPSLHLPLTLQSLFAILLPLVLNRRNAAGGILLYLILAMLGVPILANNVGGLSYFISDSGGYLVGFYLVALSSAWFKPLIKFPRLLIVFTIFIIQHVIITVLGLSWIWIMETSKISFDTHLNPFLPGMIIKSFIGSLMYEVIERSKAFFQTYPIR